MIVQQKLSLPLQRVCFKSYKASLLLNKANKRMPGVIDAIPTHPFIPRYSPKIKIPKIDAVAGTPAKKAEVGADPIFLTAVVTSNKPIRFGTIP